MGIFYFARGSALRNAPRNKRHRSHLQQKLNVSVDACSSLASLVALLYATLLAINATAHTCNKNSTFPLTRARLSLRSWLCSERKKISLFRDIKRKNVNKRKDNSLLRNFYSTQKCFSLNQYFLFPHFQKIVLPITIRRDRKDLNPLYLSLFQRSQSSQSAMLHSFLLLFAFP